MLDYRINTCRFCSKRRESSYFIKYGRRAYACVECYIAHKTIEDIEKLPRHQAEKVRAQMPIAPPSFAALDR